MHSLGSRTIGSHLHGQEHFLEYIKKSSSSFIEYAEGFILSIMKSYFFLNISTTGKGTKGVISTLDL